MSFQNTKVLLVCLIILSGINCLRASTYFVNKTEGSDINVGSLISPFKTITYGISKLNDGDTLFIREGKYYEFLNLNNKKFNKKTVIQNYQNELVEIINLSKLTNPKIQNNRLEFYTEKPIIDLFVNGQNLTKASFPNRTENKINYTVGASAFAYNNGKIDVKGTDKFNRSNTILCGLFSGKIISVVDTIKSFSGNQNYLDSTFWFWKIKEYTDTGNVYLFNNIAFLDQINEWHYENNTLYFIPENIQNKDFYEVEARIENYILDASNSSNLVFNGLHFFAGKINLQNNSNSELKNCTIKNATPFFTFKNGFEKFSPLPNKNPTPADSWSADGPDWSNLNSPENWKGNGIEVSGEFNLVENCFIAHTWGDGITIWGKGHKIKNNIINDFNWIGNDCSGISIAGLNHEITYNDISYGGRSLLLHSYLMKSKIMYNNIHHGGLICNDLGLTYAFWTDGKDTDIAYNYIHDNLGTKNQTGIYLDNWTYNFKVHHNIINNAGTGININKPHNYHQIYNNTLYKNTYSMGSWGPDGTEIKNVKTFNNLTNTNKKTKWNYDAFYGTEMDSNYIYFEDNIFQDPQNDNFQLRKYSYPIDKGITSEFTKDFNGSLPDLGAIESGSIPWEYGSTLIVPNEKYYAPKAPIHLKIVTNTPEITLFSWEYPFGMVDSFYIERKLSTEDYRIIAKVAASELTYNDAFQTGGEYRYQIRAKNAYGISEPSNTLEIFNPFPEKGIFLDAENADQQKGTKILGDELIELDNKDWIVFKQVDFGDTLLDACKIRYAVPCSNAWQNIQVRMDGFMGEILGEYITESTGGWDIFEENVFPIKPTSGIHDIYIKFRGKYGVGTIDWFELYNSNGTVEKTIQKDPKCPQPYTTNSEIPVKLFPNPGNDLLRVSFENKERANATVEIYNTIGHKISTQSFTELYPGEIELYIDSKEMDLGLKSAFYLIKVNIESEYHNQETILKYIRL